jgi:hypothetical protein
MALMMDAHEAIRCLDNYSDNLISLSLLVGASTLQSKSDQDLCDTSKSLRVMLVEKQREAMELASKIVTAKERRRVFRGDYLSDTIGVSAALERYVRADRQASDALKPRPESFAEAMARTDREFAAKQKRAKAKEARAKKAKEAAAASRLATGTINDTTAGHP